MPGGAKNPPKMDTPEHTPVLVVGAGPTGLMMALQLARRGVRALLIDKNPGPSIQTKALGVQARTLEIYAHLGIADRALELGMKATGATMWAAGRRAARVPLGDIGRGLSPYPFLLILGQDDNERLLGEALRRHGGEVRWSTELVALHQSDDAALATLRQPDGSTRRVRAAWVAGCDGARSTVRSLSGIPFIGSPYDHVFFVADTTAAGPMTPGQLNVYLWRGGFHLFFPMRGRDRWRVVGILPTDLRGIDDLQFAAVAPAVQAEVGAGLRFDECRWFSTYRIHHRRAERFRDRRCFLCGDAAHIHSPVGAQGMNTGLQDATNLAWKLALVVTGRADPALLDTYETERIPVAERLLATTDRAFSLVVSDGWPAGMLRTRVLPRALSLAMTRGPARRFAFRTISQIGIRYPRSTLSQTVAGLPEGAPRAGDRFPWLRLRFTPGGPAESLFARLDDTKFNLLLFAQALSTSPSPDTLAAGGLVLAHAVPDDPDNDAELARVAVPAPSFYLLRPDGHVALAGAGLDPAAVGRYFAERGIHAGVSAGSA